MKQDDFDDFDVCVECGHNKFVHKKDAASQNWRGERGHGVRHIIGLQKAILFQFKSNEEKKIAAQKNSNHHLWE